MTIKFKPTIPFEMAHSEHYEIIESFPQLRHHEEKDEKIKDPYYR